MFSPAEDFDLFNYDAELEEFRNQFDFQLAKKSKGPIYFGSLTELRLKGKIDDVHAKGDRSIWFGQVLATGPNALWREFDGNRWTLDKNKAFWAGAIKERRRFMLLTDIRFYQKRDGSIDIGKGTCKELLWLLDCGYSFSPDRDDPTFTHVYPPLRLRENVKICHYGSPESRRSHK